MKPKTLYLNNTDIVNAVCVAGACAFSLELNIKKHGLGVTKENLKTIRLLKKALSKINIASVRMKKIIC